MDETGERLAWQRDDIPPHGDASVWSGIGLWCEWDLSCAPRAMLRSIDVHISRSEKTDSLGVVRLGGNSR